MQTIICFLLQYTITVPSYIFKQARIGRRGFTQVVAHNTCFRSAGHQNGSVPASTHALAMATNCFPTFLPENNPIRAAGALSMPSTTSSTTVTFPSLM
uniref:Uncharacterized protein n=1 Tax=Zea mays TaxID=4577 RepID=A0A804NKY0_MAIZE